MSVRKATWVRGLVGLAVVVGLPVMAHWARRPDGTGCALDGAKIDPIYRVEISDGQGRTQAFCCLRCARIWRDRQPAPPQSITVTDEASGQRLATAAAYYVRSSVVTVPATGNRVHVFRSRADAEKHAAAHAGALLSASERPFRR